jgi:hypothetical protein
LSKRTGHKRLLPGEEDFQYDLESILRNAVHTDARRVVDRFLRYERVLQKNSNWTPLGFSGKHVVEIGCGPLLGIGPIAIYCGSPEYTCIEPRYRPEVLESDLIWKRFFLPLFQQLDVIFDRGISYNEFVDRVWSAINVEIVPIEEFNHFAAKADIVYSNGVLQHILNLENAISQIQLMSHAMTRQFHVVNFTDHASLPDDPFREIYELDPSEYFEHDFLLNLKRPTEIASMFHKSNIPVMQVNYICDETAVPDNVAPYWSRFDTSDLAVQIAFFVN